MLRLFSLLAFVGLLCQSKVIHLEFDTEQLLEDLEKLERDSEFVNALRQTYSKPQASVTNWPPKFCNGLDCPKYIVVDSYKDYEVRNYTMSHWVSTDASAVDFDQVSRSMFYKLFNYISGSNTRSEKMAITAPVLDKVTPGQGPACASNFTRSFFISESLKEPPLPSDKAVYLSVLPQITVYVRSFGGFANLSDYTREGLALANALPLSFKYDTSIYYTAGYDSPTKLKDRHNEIWFIIN